MKDIEEQLLNFFGFVLFVLFVISPTLKIGLVEDWGITMLLFILLLLSFMWFVYKPFAVLCCECETVFINRDLDEYNHYKEIYDKNAEAYNEQLETCLEMKDIYDSKYAGKTDDEALSYYYRLVTITSVLIQCKEIMDKSKEEIDRCKDDVFQKLEDIEFRYKDIAIINKITKD